jgi:hypothetical protein
LVKRLLLPLTMHRETLGKLKVGNCDFASRENNPKIVYNRNTWTE